MRLVRSTLISLIVAGVALAVAAVPALASSELPVLVAVRAAHHPGFDRVVFELRGGAPGSHSVRYVSSLTEDPSDKPVHLAGGAILQVVFHGVNAHSESGASTVTPAGAFSPGLPSLKEVAPAGDFEAVVTYGLGVDHRVPFKVLELSNPSRVAIDISTAGSSTGSAGQAGSGSDAGSGSGSSAGSSGSPGALPFTGLQTPGLLLTALALAATGLLVLVLARKTRTP